MPCEILETVFQYLEEKATVLTYPLQSINVQSKDIFQCHLTCNNWSYLAQRETYKRVILKSLPFRKRSKG
ncbi:MAG: hypothetical protein JSY10_17810 [Paenibacillus sp.]|nr:hypothetical protein [Paenibacillus sp.]